MTYDLRMLTIWIFIKGWYEWNNYNPIMNSLIREPKNKQELKINFLHPLNVKHYFLVPKINPIISWIRQKSMSLDPKISVIKNSPVYNPIHKFADTY